MLDVLQNSKILIVSHTQRLPYLIKTVDKHWNQSNLHPQPHKILIIIRKSSLWWEYDTHFLCTKPPQDFSLPSGKRLGLNLHAYPLACLLCA